MQLYIMTKTTKYDLTGEVLTWATVHKTRLGAMRALWQELWYFVSSDFDMPDPVAVIRQAFKDGDASEDHTAILKTDAGEFYGDIFPTSV